MELTVAGGTVSFVDYYIIPLFLSVSFYISCFRAIWTHSLLSYTSFLQFKGHWSAGIWACKWSGVVTTNNIRCRGQRLDMGLVPVGGYRLIFILWCATSLSEWSHCFSRRTSSQNGQKQKYHDFNSESHNAIPKWFSNYFKIKIINKNN